MFQKADDGQCGQNAGKTGQRQGQRERSRNQIRQDLVNGVEGFEFCPENKDSHFGGCGVKQESDMIRGVLGGLEIMTLNLY